MIGNDVCLTIVDVRGETVQIGIEAPLDIPVYREEIYAAIRDANHSALKGEQPDSANLGDLKPLEDGE
jgi:carbon storage regulator